MTSVEDPGRVDGGILGSARAILGGTPGIRGERHARGDRAGQRKTRRTLRDAVRAVWQASRPIGDHVAPPG